MSLRSELRSWALEVGPLLLNEFNQFCPYNWVIRKLMEPKSFPFCVLAALPIGDTRNTLNTSSFHFFLLSSIWQGKLFCEPWHVTSYCNVYFDGTSELPCFGLQSCNKIAKLWNRMFQMLYFSNAKRKFTS